ncbi:hypothetical protein [Tateyamaria omphalii]|uniref:Sulfotransferase domain-containing protein n=1 Tax=Tateyamaria omphalii TaxID=299262 RepID=A0A1P8MSD0_9RHOB|nr:hypothetical protein [Tateyamaria omphalii]APX10986.1 hypothetical protein BWR18_04235 [Tateyamaria omphalii]
MKVILHIGAHRTGTTSFQAYIRQNADFMRSRRIGFWGPLRTRKGLLSGIQPSFASTPKSARRARGRVHLNLHKAERNGTKTLLVSDENMIGTMRRNMRKRSLYDDVGERMSRYSAAFDGRIDTVVISVRSLNHYWNSVAAYCVARGHTMLEPDQRLRIAFGPRTWRDAIADVACAVPGARIVVVPFERTAGRPDAMFQALTGLHGPRTAAETWLNRSPSVPQLRELLAERGDNPNLIRGASERWTPFDPAASAAMREAYLDDIHWLTAGAEGLATLTEDLGQRGAGQTLPHGPLTRGHGHDNQERRMADPRGG